MTPPELETPVGTLLLMRPKSVAVLRGLGIALDREHRLTLLEACAAHDLNPYAVVERIHRVERGPSSAAVAQLDVGACIRSALPGPTTPPPPG